MKIAYVTIHLDSKIINGGAGHKIRSQISLWRSMGHTVDLFALTPVKISSIPDAREFPFGGSARMPILKFISRELSRSRALADLIAAVRRYRPDVIYLRYAMFSLPLHNLFKVAPLVMEVNSNDLDENRSRGLFLYWLNRLTRDLMFSRCAGWVAPSHELADLPANQRHGKQVCVVSNGIELDRYETLASEDHPTPSLTLVGSPGMNWHGVDKLIGLAEQYPELDIHIVGYSKDDLSRSIPENVSLHGYLQPADVKQVLMKTDVAFGTLALHRKNMMEASPLKVREALAYGIPVVLGYDDTDLRDVRSDLFLFLPNTPDNVSSHAQLIRDFAFHVKGKRVQRELIRPLIDRYEKEQKRLEFFEQVLKSSLSRS
jgi:glycosyltransferase involved in cell wall biosynthesis